MDAGLLRRAEGGPVVVAPLAGAPGREYRTAGDNGVRHFTSLGATSAVTAPDVREDAAGALAALRTARLLVLPGGSPSRLLDALQSTPVGALLGELLDDDVVVLGSSAGAMVLCAWTVLPDRGPAVIPGLGLVPGLVVLPHWSGAAGRESWLAAIAATVPDDVRTLGLAEQSGVLVEDGALTPVGASPAWLVDEERELPLGTAWRSR
jgi:cyanophycinase